MRRILVALRLLGSAIALYLAVSAIATWTGATIVAGAEPIRMHSRRPPEVTKAQSASHSRRPTRVVAEYNPFCPRCVEASEPEPKPQADPSAPFEGATATQLPLVLVATMEAESPQRSLATLEGPHGSGAFAVGDAVQLGVRLAAVDAGAVLLLHEGTLEYLEIGATPKTKKAPGVRRPKPKRPSRRRPWELDGARDAVECDALQCTVERSFVETLARNPAMLVSQARVRPYARDGLRGFRLSRVRSGTLPQLLGLRSGDVVTEINGRALTTMDAALAMASRLRSSSHLSVAVTRNRGGDRLPLQLEIQIVS